jgi:hypothetical protein
MLSFDRGEREIALIRGGEHDGKILKIYMGHDTKEPDIEYEYPEDILSEDFYQKNLTGRYTRDAKFNIIDPVRAAISSGSRKNIPRDALKLYYTAKKHVDETLKKELMLHDGILVPIPFDNTNTEEIEDMYIAGPAGSGKSTYTGNYVGLYKKMYKGNPVWVFSRLNKDKALDKYKVNRIILDEGLLEEPMEAKDLTKGKGALVIFDDIDTIPDKDINKEVHRLRDDLLETGRHDKIFVISTGHQLMDYKKTRTLLNEASAVTFFPYSGSKYHIKRFLKVYCGLDNKTIDKIISLPSRWVTIYKRYPMYVLHEKGCLLL